MSKDTDRWKINTDDGDLLATAPTEGQAWLKLIRKEGKCFSGWEFFMAVRCLKDDGVRAVEEG